MHSADCTVPRSERPSHAGRNNMSKRLNIWSDFFTDGEPHHTNLVLRTKRYGIIFRRDSPNGGVEWSRGRHKSRFWANIIKFRGGGDLLAFLIQSPSDFYLNVNSNHTFDAVRVVLQFKPSAQRETRLTPSQLNCVQKFKPKWRDKEVSPSETWLNYFIMLKAPSRGTRMWTTCPRLLHRSVATGVRTLYNVSVTSPTPYCYAQARSQGRGLGLSDDLPSGPKKVTFPWLFER